MSAIDIAGTHPAPVTPHPVSVAESGLHTGARVRTRIAADFTPPQLWSEPIPQLRQSWDYAVKGEQCPEDGPARAVAQVYGAITLPVLAALLATHWILQRPARLIAAVTLWFLASHVPQLGFLPFWF